MKIAFYIGPSYLPWSPKSIREKGEGGSEIATMHMAECLHFLGHEVSVYNDPGPDEGEHNGVLYLHYDKFINIEGDVLISSRRPEVSVFSPKFRKTILWCHDTHYGSSLSEKMGSTFDLALCLSQWHKNFFESYYPFMKGKIEITRNGLDTTYYEAKVHRDPYKLIYSSSPTRGLENAISIFKEVRKRTHKVSLDVFYGFDNWERTKKSSMEEIEMRMIKGLCRTEGVSLFGRVSPKELALAQMKSSIWLYPTAWKETFCITALEAQAAGLHAVTSNLAALAETAQGFLIDGDPSSLTYQMKAVSMIERLLSNPLEERREVMRKRAQEQFSWMSIAKEWEKYFE